MLKQNSIGFFGGGDSAASYGIFVNDLRGADVDMVCVPARIPDEDGAFRG